MGDKTTTFEPFIDVQLTRPFELNGVKVSTLRMREPSLLDQKTAAAVRGDAIVQESSLFCNLLEMSSDDLNRLPMRDYRRLQKAFENFIED